MLKKEAFERFNKEISSSSVLNVNLEDERRLELVSPSLDTFFTLLFTGKRIKFETVFEKDYVSSVDDSYIKVKDERILRKNKYTKSEIEKYIYDFKENKVKDFRAAKKTRFLIQILLRTSNYYLRALKQVYNDMEEAEQVLKKSTENRDLINLLEVEKTLVYFITSLKANDLVLEKLSKGTILPLYEGDLDLLEDAIIENKQAIEMSTIYRDILSSITDTYATIVSNNLNYIMKFLAGATIVLSIPTMISSFLGMNVPLGSIMTYNQAFILITVLSVVLSIVVAIILKKKNML